jgi:hypothetical protein
VIKLEVLKISYMSNSDTDSTLTEDIQSLLNYLSSSIQIIGGAITISGIVVAVTPLVLISFTFRVAQKAVVAIFPSDFSRNRREE